MPALIGRYEYALDEKGRMPAPGRYRELLHEEKGRFFILSMGLDACLYLFLPSQWERLISDDRAVFQLKDKRKQRALKRMIFSNAIEAEPDGQGRILIPPHLREHAGLGREALLLGSGSKAELWDRKRYAGEAKSSRRLLGAWSAAVDL